MNKTLLKLLFDCTDENGNLDMLMVSSSYHGNLNRELKILAQWGYVSLLADAEGEIIEIELNPKAYRLFGK